MGVWGGSPKFTLAERILANPDYIPKPGHAATLYGQLKHLREDHPNYKKIQRAFEKAGGEQKLHESPSWTL